MVDSFGIQQVRHVQVGIFANVPVGGSKDDFHFVQFAVVQARQKVDRIDEVRFVIVVAIHEGFDVKSATHGEKMADNFRMLIGNVGRAVASKTSTSYGNFSSAGIVADSLGIFVVYHPVVPSVVAHAVGRVDGFVVPAVAVDAVRAVNLNKALV